MSVRPEHPSARLRTHATGEELAALTQVLGASVPEGSAVALLDPRGRRFQRLEWLGDSVLDAVVALHQAAGPACCRDADLTSDAALAPCGVALLPVLDWQPGPERSADLVEACVGAAWLVSASTAGTVVGRLVHPCPPTRPAWAGDAETCAGLAAPARVGASVLELHVSLDLWSRYPDADEGQLSRARRPRLSRAVLGLPRPCSNDSEHLLDHVQAGVGRVAVRDGLLAGLAHATQLPVV